MFHKILIANRGEIAVRIIRACKEMQIPTVAIYSEADKKSLHVALADEAICIGPAKTSHSYLNMENIINAAIMSGADAIHPGFGFFAENASFARMCEEYNITFIGPAPDMIEKMGKKDVAKKNAELIGVTSIPGSNGVLTNLPQGIELAKTLGYPVMIKACAGGGGKGMRVVRKEDEFQTQYLSAKQEAQAAFGDDRVYLEKIIEPARHIEVQIVADSFGNIVSLGERECTLQRKNQKLLEECPAYEVTPELRERLEAASIQVAKAVNYVSLGTVEFLMDAMGNFYFMEMNTRIQVEHPITEMVTGIDLVKEQIRIAAGLPLSIRQEDISMKGHAIECRINAENPMENFRPSPGTITQIVFPGGKGVRVESAVYSGYRLPPEYDSTIAKIITYGQSRAEAIQKMKCALEELNIQGVDTNIAYQYQLLCHPDFLNGKFDTQWVQRQADVKEKLEMVTCHSCGNETERFVIEDTFHLCPFCGHYFSLPSRDRIQMIVDEDSFEEYYEELTTCDPLMFPGYKEKQKKAKYVSGLNEAIIVGKGKIQGCSTMLGVMDTRYFMGSMGTVVGEKITRLFEEAVKEQLPVVIFCASGGARMQEGIYSLMQMAKVSAAVKRHSDAGLLYLSVLTNPTTGGVTASFAMQGDIIIAEPGALIGFAGPRVIEQTLHETLPDGFQRSEFLLEHGLIDRIVPRDEMAKEIGTILRLHY